MEKKEADLCCTGEESVVTKQYGHGQTAARRIGGTFMRKDIIIRRETEDDRPRVEEIVRRAFYNLYIPGAAEHYLVHIMRSHPDFIQELDLVLELEGQVIGAIMYTRTHLVDERGEEREILTFGPVCVLPEYQRMGYGKMLMEASFQKAVEMGYDTIVIFGAPGNYVSRGFKSCKRYNVCLENGSFPAAMLVKELVPGSLDGRKWVYRQSPVFEFSEEEALAYDDTLEPLEKKELPCQEEFYILSSAMLPE